MKRRVNLSVVFNLCLILSLVSVPLSGADSEIKPLTATASSQVGGWGPANAVDGNLDSVWWGGFNWGDGNWWIKLDCKKEYQLNKISIWWDSSYGAKNYDIQTSSDGINWHTEYSGLDSSNVSNPVSYSLSRAACYVRIYINKSKSFYLQIHEIKLYAAPAVNQPPTATASVDKASGTAPLTVKFSGSGADPDGAIAGYSWNFGDGSTSGQQNPTHTYTTPATRTATLTVTDNDGAKATAALAITVAEPANQRPTATISANLVSGPAPLTINFTGSGTDPDGIIASYSWNFGDGETSSQQNPSHTYTTPATCTVVLTVTDNDGATKTASLPITVNEPPNQLPTASASANLVSGPAPLTINFTGSGTDPDGIIASYSWNFGDGETSSQQNPSHEYADAGTYIAALIVTDDKDASATDNLTISVSLPIGGIPRLIRFQALLEDKQENPLNGDFKLTFRIYDKETSGGPLWQEIQPGVSVEEGVLDVKLGSVNELNLLFDKPYWLGVEVESDGEMTPRFDFTTVPYAYNSAQ